MKRKSMLALLLAVSMTCSMTAATGTVAFASDDAATEEAADDTEAAAEAGKTKQSEPKMRLDLRAKTYLFSGQKCL